jgi:long-chain fatty acid transport protein
MSPLAPRRSTSLQPEKGRQRGIELSTRPITGAARAICVCLSVLGTGPALAANGFVQPGNSAAELGMAGAGTALTERSSAALRNPAAGAWMGSGLSLELGLARPEGWFRSGPTGSDSSRGVLAIDPVATDNIEGFFPVPAVSYNRRISDTRAWGLGLRFNGLETEIDDGSATLARGFPTFAVRCQGAFGGGLPLAGQADTRALCGATEPTVSAHLAQIFLSAHFAQRIGPRLSIGVAPILAVQRLDVGGLSAFRTFSVNPEATSDEGAELSWGGALQLGAIWRPHTALTFAAAVQSQSYTRSFGDYEGVLIDGHIDQPPVLDLGLSLAITPHQRLVFDFQRIWHSQIETLSNRLDANDLANGCLLPRMLGQLRLDLRPLLPADDRTCLGGENGPGLGLRDLNVYKLGYQWRQGRFTLRAGFSWTQTPQAEDQALAAVIGPAVTKRHIALGLGWDLSQRLQLDAALMHAAVERLRGPNPLSSVGLELGLSPLLGLDADADAADQRIEVELEVWQFHMGLNWRFGGDPT